MNKRKTEHKKIVFQNKKKLKRADELIIVNEKLKKAEAEVRKQNEELEQQVAKRITQYNFISQINQNIVHVKDEKTLLGNACRIADEIGGFEMAWIGFFDLPNQKISLVEQSGMTEEDIRLFTEVIYDTKGYQAYVLSNQTYYVSNDVETELDLEIWKPFATRHNIRSIIVLPILKLGQIIGTLNLYSTEQNFFGKEDILLLIEVIGNISFALDNFEKEKKLKSTEALIEQNENRFRALVENGTDAVAILSATGSLLYVSPNIERILGYKDEEILKLDLFSLFHPDDLAGVGAVMEKVIATPGISVPGHTSQMLHKDGSWRWIEATVTNMLHDPTINGIIDNFRDVTGKVKAEQQKDFNKNNLKALINNTNDLMWSIDRNFKLITFNQPFYDFIELMSGKKSVKGGDFFSNALTQEQKNRFKLYYERAFAGESFAEIEYGNIRDEFWKEVSFNPIRKGEEIIGVACHLRDITQMVLHEKTIKAERIFLRTLLDNLPSLVYIKDIDSKKTLSNRADYEYLGALSEEEVIGKDDSWFFSEETSNETFFEEQRIFKTGEPVISKEEYQKKKDGSEVWFLISKMPLRNQYNEIVGLLGISHDITERKEVERKLLLTQFVFDNAGDAIYWMRPDSKIIKVNDAACQMLGYSEEEMLKLSVPDIDPFFSYEVCTDYFEKIRQEGSLIFETIQQAKDGRLIPVEIRANYIKFGDSEFNCAFCRDISERKIAEEEREKITTDIVQRNKELEQFSYIVSHNLRSPIANIIGLTDIVKDETLEPELKKEVIHGLSQSVQKLDDIIFDLNNILQIKRDIVHLKEKVRFSELVHNIQISNEHQIERANATILCDFSEIDEMLTLKTYLYSIFFNLITNSLKYRQLDIPPIIEIKSRMINNTIEIIFKDNGSGIDLTKKGEQIFGLYKRFHPDVAEGKGMGLYMVKTQVESIGGKISVESEVNKGTTFKIEFYNK